MTSGASLRSDASEAHPGWHGSLSAPEPSDPFEIQRNRRNSVVRMRTRTSVHPGDPNPQEPRRFGFAAGRRAVTAIDPLTSVHSEIEMLFLLRGWMEYSVAGRTVRMEPGRLHVFWGGLPHRGLRLRPPTEYVGVVVPLEWVLAWPLPAGFAQDLVHGRVMREPDPTPERRRLDRALMIGWHADMREPNPGVREAVAISVQSRLRRLALAAGESDRGPAGGSCGGDVVANACQFIVDNYRAPIALRDVAAAAGVGKRHLMNIFKECCDESVWDYVVQLRLAHAERLLLSSELSILDVAVESGFGSSTRFYEAFRRARGISPRRYREQEQRLQA